MRTIFADFETYYDKEFSLRKITPVEYILSPLFETIGLAVKEGIDGTAYWLEGPDLPRFFAALDPKDTSLVTHNALFDVCVCAWRYRFVPKLVVDTMGVSRACLGHLLKSHSLASVGTHLELGVKGDTIAQAIGMRLADLQARPDFYARYKAYALNDVEICAGIYDKLVRSGRFPIEELAVMDMVLKCAIKPKLQLDQNVLLSHLAGIEAQKANLLSSAGVDKSELMSNEKFAQALRTHGVEPPMKVSKVTGQVTYAFAKTDQGMVALEEHENPAVQALVAARVGHKSTLEETRTRRMLNISQLQWGDGCSWVPVPLRFSGAHTHRLSGDWKLNMQNLPRKSPLRHALVAPPGHTIVAVDASQIEARGVAWICGQDDLVAQFENKEDVYSSFASDLFWKPINKKDNPGERFIGKVNILQLGYGSGAMTLLDAIRVQSKSQLGQEMIVPFEEAQRYVNVYRTRYPNIPLAWRILGSSGIHVLANGGTFEFGPCKFELGSILLPNGLRLFYENLRRIDGEWWFDHAGKPEKLYGGKLLENIVQALARIQTMSAGVRIQKRLELALQVHDELGYVVPDEHVEEAKAIVVKEMCRRPSWAPGWPLDAEVNTGKSYGDAK